MKTSAMETEEVERLFLENREFKPDPYFEEYESKCDASKYKVFSIKDALALFAGRKIYIWGAGQKGRGFLLALRRNNFEVEAFLDSSSKLIGTPYQGVPVIRPEVVIDEPDAADNVFVLTATVDSKNKEIFRQLGDRGFVQNKSFTNLQLLSPFYPTVEVTGLCNLHCASCPRSDDELLATGKYMSFMDYKKVVLKMVNEIPFLYLIDLYMWGEPMLNKQLPEMIELNNTIGLATGLSTNLNNIRNLERVLDACPAQLRVSLSGMSETTYEVTHTGGKWERVKRNLKILGESVEKRQHKTIIELYFHVYKHNLHEIKEVVDLCKRYKFRFHPALAIVLQDYALKYARTGEVPEHVRPAVDRLLIDMDKLLKDCMENSDKGCVLTRVIPAINWDLKVLSCCSYASGEIAPSFLNIKLNDLVKRRTVSETCGTCQKYSLHRWNDQSFYSAQLRESIAIQNDR